MTEFTPVTARGRELRQLVLERIEREVRLAEVHETNDGDLVSWDQATRAGLWDQGTWGRLDGNKLLTFGVELSSYTDQVEVAPEVAVECGTSFCFAGHASVMVGDRPILTLTNYGANTAEMLTVKPFDAPDRVLSVSERASELMELTPVQSQALFAAENTLDDIRTILRRIDDGLEISRCDDCEEFTWNCDYDGVVCSRSGEHEEECACIDCLPDDDDEDDDE